VPDGWLDFLRAHAKLNRELDAAMRAQHDLTLNEYEVLLKLWLADDCRLRRVDLACELLITQGGVTRLLAGLEERKLVERVPCESDGRVAYAALTPAGIRTLEAARASHLADVERLYKDRFSAAELRSFAELVARLHD
jgi:DNA-binding MarR family transcriptional regulator